MSFFKKTSSSPPSDSNTTDHEVRNADDRTGLFRIGSGRKGRCEMCTEGLGFESLAEKMDGCGDDDLTMESLLLSSSSPLRLRSRSRMTKCGPAFRERTRLNDLPPLLSTLLDESGRPRFEFNKVRRNGRLEIKMVRNDKPGVVRIRGGDGEVLRMEMVMKRDDQEEEEEESEGNVMIC